MRAKATAAATTATAATAATTAMEDTTLVSKKYPHFSETLEDLAKIADLQ